MKKLFAIFSLCRCQNCFLAGFAVWVGAYTSGIIWLEARLLHACVVAMLITAGGNVTNDIADCALDREFKAHRPLASNILSKATAWILSALLLATGMLLSLRISSLHTSIALLVIVLLLLYNFYFKRIPVLGNVVIALLSGLPFLYGGLLSNEWKWSLIPFVFAVLVHFGREILKSVEDVDGDMRHGIRTIAGFVSKESLKRIAISLFVLVIVLCVLPYVLGWYNYVYLIIVSIGVFLPKAFIFSLLFRPNWLSSFDLIHRLLKIEMFAGSIAILLAR